MKNFNITRFGQALKCHFMVERKTWIRLFGIFTLVMFMSDLFLTRVAFSYTVTENMSAEELLHTYCAVVGRTTGFGVVFFCFSMLFGATGMFSQMKDTRKRSAYLLWPVSNLEKYVVSLLLSILWLAVMTIVAYLLADTLRVFIDWVTGRVVIWGLPLITTTVLGPAPFEHWQMAWMLLSWAFYIHSLYIVGGTLFRRQQFLLTSATIVVVGILLVMLLNKINPQVDFISSDWDEKTGAYTHTYFPFFYILHSTLCALVIFHYWASYKLFTRMQVINNKWLNV